MRILLIEPDHATAQSIELMMKAEGFNVYTTDLGEEGVDLAKIYDYDLILLELELSDMSGFDVLRQIRVGKVITPIMILSNISAIEAKVKSFGGGADDYMTKPFHRDELVVRCHSIVRRSKGHAQATVSAGNISLNLDAKIVEVSGHRVHLTQKEYQMLELLFLRKGSTLTKEMFLNHLYGGMDEPEFKIVDVFICKLRKKLARANGGEHHIETVWGRGYVLRCPSEEASQNITPAVKEAGQTEADQEQEADQEIEVAIEAAPSVAPVRTSNTRQPKKIGPPSQIRIRMGHVLDAIRDKNSRFTDILSKTRAHLPEVTELQVRGAIAKLLQERIIVSTRSGRTTRYTQATAQEAAA